MKTHELRLCPVCGGPEAGRREMGPAWHLRTCANCGTVYAPEYADPEDLYVDGYRSAGPSLLDDGQPVGELTAAGPGLDIQDPAFQRYLARVGATRLRILGRVARPPGTLLDVGCGTGETLAVARQEGWTVTGVDPVTDAAAFCRDQRGLDVRTGLLQDVGLPERSFDVVMASHVLEHIPKATEFLELLARWVRPGGHILVEVPNFRSVQRRNMGANWPGLRPLEHVVHFSAASLSHAFTEAGLVPAVIRTPSYIGPPQNLHYALADLGQSPLRRLFKPLCRPGPGGDDDLLPSGPAWAALHAMARVYDRFRVGLVVVGVARLP